MRFLAKVCRTWLTPSQGRHRADSHITAAALSFWAFVDSTPRQTWRAACRSWPRSTYRAAPGYSRSYLAAVTALSCVLVIQHVVSREAAADPAVTASEFVFALGAGGHTVAAYLDPPPDVAPAKLPGRARAKSAAVRPGKRHVEAVSGIPSTVLAAYQNTTETLRSSQPRCRLAMPLLAAIGKVESGHARGGDVDAAGTTRTPILGPPLNGAPGIAAIGDTDGGAYDRDTTWDRAVGPMQFIPSTWRVWASDGNSDGSGDPNNIYDATLAAGRYLCAAGVNLATGDGLRRAVLAYNHSQHYLQVVLSWMRVYAGGAVAVPDGVATADRPAAKPRTSKAPEPQPAAPSRKPKESTEPSSPRSAPTPQRQTPRADVSTVSTQANPPPRRKQRDDRDGSLGGATLPDLPPIAPPQLTPRESITLP